VGLVGEEVEVYTEDITYNPLELFLEKILETLLDDALYFAGFQQRYVVDIACFMIIRIEVHHDFVVIAVDVVVMVGGCLRCTVLCSHHNPKMPSCIGEVDEVAAIGPEEDWVCRVDSQIELRHFLNHQILLILGNSGGD